MESRSTTANDIKSEAKQAVDDVRRAMAKLARLLARKAKGDEISDKQVLDALCVASLGMGRLAGLVEFLADYATKSRH